MRHLEHWRSDDYLDDFLPLSPSQATLRLAPFELDTARLTLMLHGKRLRLGCRALTVLTALVEARGALVRSDDLMRRAWPDTFVDEANLRVQISALRKSLRELGSSLPYIINVPGQGYRVGVAVEPIVAANAVSVEGRQGFAQQRTNQSLVYFGNFSFDSEHCLLFEGGCPVRLGSRALAILALLLERPGELMKKDEVARLVWPGLMVEEVNLRVHLAAIRRALGDNARQPKFIANDPGRGYRFIARLSPFCATLQRDGTQMGA